MNKPTSPEAAHPHVVIGRVVSNRMQKTIVVSIERQWQHPKYGKILRRSTRISAHDEQNECAVGDRVSLRECRPRSATKHWTLVKVLEKAPAPVAEAAV
ncbi:MAG: 30S ribosomal protein S17 [Nevskiales bacterium]|nr:30S ribosomal protein S17 [Nevskiales bacterium]